MRDPCPPPRALPPPAPPFPARGVADARGPPGFAPARERAAAELPEGAGRPVALAVGFLDPPRDNQGAEGAGAADAPEGMRRSTRRKMAAAVLTEGDWTVRLFDHNLKLLWEAPLADGTAAAGVVAGARASEAALLVAPVSLREGDRGVVVAGVGLMRPPGARGSGAGRGGGQHLWGHSDPMQAELEREAARAGRTQPREEPGRGWEDEDAEGGGGFGRVDLSHHFTLKAMEGGTGKARWEHRGGDFLEAAENPHDSLTPQHHYRLDAESLEDTRHLDGCRDFRESVLAQLPHRWSSPRDTRISPARFLKHRHAAQKAPLDGARRGQGAEGHPADGDLKHPHGTDHDSSVANALGRFLWWSGLARSGQREDSKQRHARGDAHGVDSTQHVSHHHQQGTRHFEGRRAGPPNALVAHVENGIEAVHLYTGRTLCRLALRPGAALHADVNADGVPDEVEAWGGSPWGVDSSHAAHHHHREGQGGCWAQARSGVPPREFLFDGSICRHGAGGAAGNLHSMSRSFGQRVSGRGLEIAPPAAVPVQPGSATAYVVGRRHRRRMSDIAFLNSKGELTLLSPAGDRLWSIASRGGWPEGKGSGAEVGTSSWALRHEVHDDGVPPQPTLDVFQLRPGTHSEVLLAAGTEAAVVVSPQGRVLAELDLPGHPAVPMAAADFSGDGLSDIMLVSDEGIFAWSQVRRPGGLPFAVVVGAMLVAMVAIYFTHHGLGAKGVRRKRATERDD